MVRRSGRSPAAALFDVDGTLVDTNYLNAVTWWDAFSQAGHYVPMAQIHRAIGMGSDQMLDKLLPPGRDKDADADIRTAHGALYAVYWPRLRPLPGATDLLRACKKRGLAVVLASSAEEPEFNMLRSVLDAEKVIDGTAFYDSIAFNRLWEIPPRTGSSSADAAPSAPKADITGPGLTLDDYPQQTTTSD